MCRISHVRLPGTQSAHLPGSIFSLLVLSLPLFFAVIAAEPGGPSAEAITEALKKEDWALADSMLARYMEKTPDQKWTYTSRAWALRNLKKFSEAIRVSEEGLKRWPEDVDLKKSAAFSLGELAAAEPPARSIPLLLRALDYHRIDYLLYRLARAHRDSGQYQEAAGLLEKGALEFPEYPYFSQTLPYTRYLLFKQHVSDKSRVRQFVNQSVDWLNPARSLQDQEHYLMIINTGLRALADMPLLRDVYQKLLVKFPDNATLYDQYGFALYAGFRMHGGENTALREEAIALRRKANQLFWQNNVLPPAIENLGFPLRGLNQVWSEFGGTAMTHNGFARFCYDFAAVDEEDRIFRPGTRGENKEDYYMFGKPVHAVAAGVVTGVVDGYPDNSPSGYGAEANTITVQHGGFYSFYAHMKSGGIVVREKQTVQAGDLLGYAGNSGMSSQPHLHFCVYGTFAEWVTVPFQFKKARVKTTTAWIVTDRPYREGETVNFE